jgi:hypothetical protein
MRFQPNLPGLNDELRSSEGQKEKLRRARAALNAAKFPAGKVAGFGKPRLVIAAAKYGNRSVIRRRD